jgi:hypothetical protein
LAEYLQLEFPKWHVDCEYNRLGDENKVKKLDIPGIGKPHVRDTETKTVFPDIIVHHRKKKENLLVMEVNKAKGKADTGDVEKLQAFTEEPEYEYQYRLFLRLGAKLQRCKLKLFQDGKCRDSWTKYLDAPCSS